MSFLAVSSFLNCAAVLCLGIIVWRQCPQKEVRNAYTIFNVVLAFYSLFYGLWQASHDATHALFYHHFLFLGVIWVNQGLIFFTISFLNRAKASFYRIIFWVCAVLNVGFSILNFTGGLYDRVEPRYGLGFWPVPTHWAIVYIAFWHAVCFFCFGLLVRAAWRGFRDGARVYAEQVVYLVVAFNLGYFGGATNWPMWFGIHFPPYLNSLIVVYAGIIAYAIVKHHLMDMEVILKRTLAYSIVTGALAIVYVSVVTLAANALQGWVTLSREFSAGIAAAFVALLFHPARVRVQAFLDEKFFRSGSNPRERWGDFSGRVTGHTQPEELALSLFDVLEDAYHPNLLVLYLRSRDGQDFVRFTPVAGSALPGEMPPDNVWVRGLSQKSSTDQELFREMQRIRAVGVFPLINATGLAGYLFLGGRKSDLQYVEDDWRLIRMSVQEVSMAYEHMRYPVTTAQQKTENRLQDVSSGMIHEIKTPLANISLPAQATFADLNAIEQGKRRLEEILPKLKDRMKFIISQTAKAGDRIAVIRDFAAVEDTHRETVNIIALVEECLAGANVILEEHQVQLHKDFATAGSAFITGQPKQLEIVFTNLFKNAAEATSAAQTDPAKRHLWVKIQNKGDYVQVLVRDSGLGVKKEDQPHLFEKHFTTKGSAGTGIGLYFSHQIVSAHGGRITCESRENEGAEFTVSLPKAA